MWYIITIVVVFSIFYKLKQKKERQTYNSSDFKVSILVDNSEWEQRKKDKKNSLDVLKKNFVKPVSLTSALLSLDATIRSFVQNHGASYEDLSKKFHEIKLPDDLIKQEALIRKEINFYYKDRKNSLSKAYAIFLAFKHTKLLIENPDINWKNFSGLQRLQTNLKAEEYFESLIGIMFWYAEIFKDSDISRGLSEDIDKIFELWNSRNIAFKAYEENCDNLPEAKSSSDKHFIILSIIEYLDRRYKFNPTFKGELIEWCLKDTDLYEDFLKEFHAYHYNSFNSNGDFITEKYTFDDVKTLKEYLVPRLLSFDILWEIYEGDENQEKLAWLSSINSRIEYRKFESQSVLSSQKSEPTSADVIDNISTIIEVKKSGDKGKRAFLNSKGELCSTEEAYKDCMENKGFHVMRAEVSFWQAMFCFSFWEEIFQGMDAPELGSDIPEDMFQGSHFYTNRKNGIDRKFEYIKNHDLKEFINKQKSKYRMHWTRLVYNGDQDMASYFDTKIVQIFLDRIDADIFSRIIYRISQNPNENRSGVSDFVVWNDEILKMVEVKTVREKIRDSQVSWIQWMDSEGIPIEIVRIKGV
jgi:hypothetical protein